MRAIILSTIIFWGCLSAGITPGEELATNAAVGATTITKRDPSLQKMIDSWAKGAETNGIVCGISFTPSFGKRSSVFYVNLINTTTNFIRGLLRIPIDGRANIDLLDSEGKPVPKTDAGIKVGVWTDQQIKDWFENNREKPWPFGHKESKGIADILFPLWPVQIGAGISLPQLFQIKQAGEYTLHFQMRVAQTRVDTSGKIELNIFWLPEVVTKVQVSHEDITPPNLLLNSQTN
jgi:hypothetical protein